MGVLIKLLQYAKKIGFVNEVYQVVYLKHIYSPIWRINNLI